MLRRGEIERVDRGLYRVSDAPLTELETVATVSKRIRRWPSSCLLTASAHPRYRHSGFREHRIDRKARKPQAWLAIDRKSAPLTRGPTALRGRDPRGHRRPRAHQLAGTDGGGLLPLPQQASGSTWHSKRCRDAMSTASRYRRQDRHWMWRGVQDHLRDLALSGIARVRERKVQPMSPEVCRVTTRHAQCARSAVGMTLQRSRRRASSAAERFGSIRAASVRRLLERLLALTRCERFLYRLGSRVPGDSSEVPGLALAYDATDATRSAFGAIVRILRIP